jgi:uncharacterized protein DUF1800
MAAPVYRGHFGRAEAKRLLWRAGFGPRPGEAERLVRRGLEGAVRSLINPGRERLHGPKPRDDKGRPLAPRDAYGHDHLWWLDRMVRTNRPLVERMTLIWHDWFATSNDGVGSQRLMLKQNALFRRHALGSFRDLLLAVTHDPAMLLWLNGVENEKEAPTGATPASSASRTRSTTRSSCASSGVTSSPPSRARSGRTRSGS